MSYKYDILSSWGLSPGKAKNNDYTSKDFLISSILIKPTFYNRQRRAVEFLIARHPHPPSDPTQIIFHLPNHEELVEWYHRRRHSCPVCPCANWRLIGTHQQCLLPCRCMRVGFKRGKRQRLGAVLYLHLRGVGSTFSPISRLVNSGKIQ